MPPARFGVTMRIDSVSVAPNAYSRRSCLALVPTRHAASPSAYAGKLPVDVCFLAAGDEVVQTLSSMGIVPVMTGRAATARQ
jgi:hypothetical protein